MINNKELIIAWLGTIGYLLSAIGYIARVFSLNIYTMTFLYGTVFVSLGYGLLFIFNVKEVASIKNEESESKKHEDIHEDIHEAKPKDEKNNTVLLRTGYFFLFLFFAGSHFLPSLTERVRYYDVFAASGYLLNILTDYISFYIPILLLLIYYICGSYQKILDWKESGINKLQLVSRSILVVYYGLHLV